MKVIAALLHGGPKLEVLKKAQRAFKISEENVFINLAFAGPEGGFPGMNPGDEYAPECRIAMVRSEGNGRIWHLRGSFAWAGAPVPFVARCYPGQNRVAAGEIVMDVSGTVILMYKCRLCGNRVIATTFRVNRDLDLVCRQVPETTTHQCPTRIIEGRKRIGVCDLEGAEGD